MEASRIWEKVGEVKRMTDEIDEITRLEICISLSQFMKTKISLLLGLTFTMSKALKLP